MSTVKLIVEIGVAAIHVVGEVLDAGLEAAGYAAALIDYYYDTGNPDRDRDNDKQKAVTLTQVQVGASTAVHETIKVTWSAAKWLQDAQFTCTDDNARAKNPKATSSWTNQQTDRTWWVFTKSDYVYPAQANAKPGAPACQADEWPPAYFVEDLLDVNIALKKGQLVRWLPRSENTGAASLWTAFCNKNDGGAENGQFNKDGNVNEALVDVQGAPRKKKVQEGKNGKPVTTTELFEADYTRAVFSMIRFPLLTDDYFYTTRADANRALAEGLEVEYSRPPQAARLQQAQNAMPGVVLRRDLGLDAPDLFSLDAGDLALSDANSTRRLTAEDMPNVEVIPCRDRLCKEELAAIEDKRGFGVIPGAPVPTLPAVVVAEATTTNAPLTMVMMVRSSDEF
ncbi:hypothetical protein BU23DRAFT_563027 [Bimuria novae-zelandiae CBS 107.79]|uniref:Uncharacterized protein n=1 Tax=Bimuria novae-zelandiae CBS 107.79 TaxID=1447943 RepID=A0A6A5VQV5_9PLEO|nr:hypothetical protein BU23DRAFT_563027 [Bimuria novae-zelandiae CBS 107.79]